jgi:hypothetical protein
MPTGYGLLPELDGGLRTIRTRAIAESLRPPTHADTPVAPASGETTTAFGRLWTIVAGLIGRQSRHRRASPRTHRSRTAL